MEFIKKNLENEIKLGNISKKSNFKDIKENVDLRTLISFKEFRSNYPEWGENIEEFLVNSEIFGNLKKNDIEFSNQDVHVESAISII